MKRALHLLLVLGALLGLLGQEEAYAVGPQSPVMPVAASTMDADCMAMMPQEPQPAEKPCKGMTLDCIAAMGCVVPIVLRDPVLPMSAPETRPVRIYWSTAVVLVGSGSAPELHPPTILG